MDYFLAARLAETDAEKVRTHYFLLARFTLDGSTLDVRRRLPNLHLPDDRGPSLAFGAQARASGAAGITCHSVRRARADNVAVFKAGLVRAGARIRVIGMRWNGSGMSAI
jgi:hypothetical protein